MSPLRSRIRRWASRLPDGLVDVSVFLIALAAVSLLMAAITIILTGLIGLANGSDKGISIVAGFIVVSGLALALPMIVAFAYVADWLVELVGTRCPVCEQRELGWRSGTWKYGDPPDYHYFACANCGATFRQLYGGQGVLSELERVEHLPEVAPPPESPGATTAEADSGEDQAAEHPRAAP